MYTYDHVDALTPEEVRALARRILLEHTVEATSDDLYNDPDRLPVYAIARRLGVSPACLLDGALGKLAIARALVGDPVR